MNPVRLPALPRAILLVVVTLSGCGSAPPASGPAAGMTAPASAGPAASAPNSPALSPVATPGGSAASVSPSGPVPASSPARSGAATPPAGSTRSPIPIASAGIADELGTPGTLIACTTFGSPAMATYDASGKPVGVNVDIDTELAHRLGLSATIENTPFDRLIDDVVAGRCDISVSSQIILPSRLARIDMIPYTQGVPHLAMRAGDFSIATLLDACGRRVSVREGSILIDYVRGTGDYSGRGLDQACAGAKRQPVDLRVYADEQLAIDALAAGEVDAFIGNDLIAFQRPAVFRLGPEMPARKEGIGVARTHNALRRAIEAAFKAMIADGTYRDILHRYGADVISIARP